jgi:hypothetical protein
MTLQSTPAQQPITDKLVTPQWLIWFNSIVTNANSTIFGTFTLNGATPIVVSEAQFSIADYVGISLNTVGGTVGALPTLKTVTDGVGFTIAGTAGDTSIYNYIIKKNI